MAGSTCLASRTSENSLATQTQTQAIGSADISNGSGVGTAQDSQFHQVQPCAPQKLANQKVAGPRTKAEKRWATSPGFDQQHPQDQITSSTELVVESILISAARQGIVRALLWGHAKRSIVGEHTAAGVMTECSNCAVCTRWNTVCLA